MSDNPPSQTTGGLPFRPSKSTMVVTGLFIVFIGFSLLFLAHFIHSQVNSSSSTFFIGEEDGSVFLQTTCLISALFALVLGFGSVYACKWARAVLLALGWVLIYFGAILFISMAPIIYEIIIYSVSLGNLMGLSDILITLAIPLVFPLAGAILVVIYKSQNVKLTAQHYHPKPNWTDQLPTSVLSLLIFWVAFAFLLGASLVTHPDHQGSENRSIFYAIITPFYLFLAFGLGKMAKWAWYGSLIAELLLVAQTFFFPHTEDGVESNLYSDIIIHVFLLAYIFWIRRHFFKPKTN